MATSTTNLGLTKPAGTDKIRIAQINGNMDILDEKIGAVGNTSLQAQVTSQNEAIANKANFVSLGTFTEATFSGFLKAVCASYYSNSEADKAVNFVATWSGHNYYTGLIRKHSNDVFCMTFVGNDMASCIYNASNQSISVNDINDQIAALNSVIYNANTDRNVESNRTTVMEYLKSNYFDNKYSRAMVRYASGYYHGYVFVGEYTGSDSLIIEIPHNMTSGEKMIVWRRLSSGEYTKQFSLT